jgi:hypothetical protein
MIVHVVLFRPREGLPGEDRLALLRGLADAVRDIPAIRRLRIGRRVRHGLPGYEQAMRDDYEYAVIVEFDDLDGLIRYLTHPAHAALGRHFTHSSDAALAYDYRFVEASDLALLA